MTPAGKTMAFRKVVIPEARTGLPSVHSALCRGSCAARLECPTQKPISFWTVRRVDCSAWSIDALLR